MDIILIGFGTVGKGLVANSARQSRTTLREQHGFEARIVGVATRTRGTLYRPDGLDIDAAAQGRSIRPLSRHGPACSGDWDAHAPRPRGQRRRDGRSQPDQSANRAARARSVPRRLRERQARRPRQQGTRSPSPTTNCRRCAQAAGQAAALRGDRHGRHALDPAGDAGAGRLQDRSRCAASSTARPTTC